MNDPVDLSAVREARSEKYDGLTCPCGSAWFTVQAVAVGPNGTVTAHAAPLVCRECATVITPGAWAPPNLQYLAGAADSTRACPCRPENGGSGVCGCALGGPQVTC